MLVFDDSNYRALIGDGQKVRINGEDRLLSRLPPPRGHDKSSYSRPFSEVFSVIPRNEWSARIKEQKAKRCRVSDYQRFEPHDQDGLPTCWANGPAHALTTMRVMQGLPLVYISACSVAVPISGGHRGGYEGEALEHFAKYGGVSCDLWPNNDTKSHDKDPKVQEDRKRHVALEFLELNGFDEFATACLLGFCSAIAYNWWNHVVSLSDLLEIEAGSYGLWPRNNWGDWGDKNDYGFSGYAAFREGKGTPDSGFVVRQVTLSVT